jgi:signal transduction histidine kinase
MGICGMKNLLISPIQRLWRDMPLASKIALLASLLVVLVILGLSSLNIQRERVGYREDLESQVTILMDTLPLTLRDQLYLMEVDELQDIATEISDNPDVTQFRVFSAEGVLIVDSASDEPLFEQEPTRQGETLAGLGRDQLLMDWQPDQLVAGRSIWVGNQKLGAISIGLSTAPLNQEIASLTQQSFVLTIGALALGVLLAVLLSRQLTAPLDELTGIASRMAGGDLTVRWNRARKDEIGQVGQAFNTMANSIQQRETDLRDLARGLEMMVLDRTRALEEQNKALSVTNDELSAARKDAEAANRLKSEFLASMSHELRTPLNAIMGFSQVLMAGVAGELTEKQNERIGRIYNSGQTLLNMINDILDISKIEAGRMEIVNRPFVVADWLGEINKQLEGLAQAKSLEFNVKHDPGLPETLVGDETRLKQIATNLISNAIKFTDAGKINVEISKHEDDNWAIIVTDTGIGIPSHALDFIFDEFRQVDGSTQRKHGGTGLGLAIVRKLAMLMGGTVQVDSSPGVGSTFTVMLPLVVEEGIKTADG